MFRGWNREQIEAWITVVRDHRTRILSYSVIIAQDDEYATLSWPTVIWASNLRSERVSGDTTKTVIVVDMTKGHALVKSEEVAVLARRFRVATIASCLLLIIWRSSTWVLEYLNTSTYTSCWSCDITRYFENGAIKPVTVIDSVSGSYVWPINLSHLAFRQ